ncbi:unnamed protein product [Schistosoma turkestanicum]|nr:unnamed protein product [Schistosoma turkestanicum]
MTEVTNLSVEQDENIQDVLEFEDNLEKMSRDLVSDILSRAKSSVVNESSNSEQIMLSLQDSASPIPQLSILSPNSPECSSKNDKNSEEYANSFLSVSLNQQSVINEALQPSNIHEEITIQQIPLERKLFNQCQTEFDFNSNTLNDFRGIGVGSATPDTPRHRDYQTKSSRDLPLTNNTIFTPSYNSSQKHIYLREMSPSPSSLSYDLIRDNSIALSQPTNPNYTDEFMTSSRMLTYRQDAPTVINTNDIEQKLKPFSSPLPVYIPSTACTRILKHSGIHRFTGSYDSQLSKFKYNDFEIDKLPYSDRISPELEKLTIEYESDNYNTINKKQNHKPNIPRLQLPSSPKVSYSPKTNQTKLHRSSLKRDSITSRSDSFKIPKSTSSSLCWWEPLDCHDAHAIEHEQEEDEEQGRRNNHSSYHYDKPNLPEPNPEVLKRYYYLCAQQPMKEASLMKAINEAELKAKYDKMAHYEFLRRKSLQRCHSHHHHQHQHHHYKRTRFSNSHQSRKFDIESKYLNQINPNNTSNLCRPENFIYLLQKENKPKKPSQYPSEDNFCSMVNKSKNQRSALSSSTIHNVSHLN